MKRFLVSILALGIISGILPILVASFLFKHIALMVLLIVFVLVWLAKELCD